MMFYFYACLKPRLLELKILSGRLYNTRFNDLCRILKQKNFFLFIILLHNKRLTVS